MIKKRSITQKIDRVTQVHQTYRNQKKTPPPISVKIELTSICNYDCAFCARSQNHRKTGHINESFYRSCLMELFESGVQEIGLFYLGESFLLPWLPEAVSIAKDIGFSYIFLTTNGSLASPDKVESCMRNGLNSLKFSLNYSDAHQFHEITGAKASQFEKVLSNIKQAKQIRDENNFDCGLYASYILYDGDQGEKMKGLINSMNPYLDEIYALPLYSQANLVEAEEKKRDWSISAGNRGRIGALRDPIPCWSIFTEGHITFDGKLSACCFDHDGRFEMGDLNRESFSEAWNSEKFIQLRQAHLNKNIENTPCSSCIAYE